MITRRAFVRGATATMLASPLVSHNTTSAVAPPAVAIGDIQPEEDAFAYIRRIYGGHDAKRLAAIFGAANEFKEGDELLGLAAADRNARSRARQLLSRTQLASIDAHPVYTDPLWDFIRQTDRDETRRPRAESTPATLEELKQFVLTADENAIQQVMPVLSSDVIGCLVKIMSNEELIQVSSKVFNPLPGSQIGAKGYLGARIQPNSPTDHLDDIRWQVFDGWSYAVGDVLLGTNPVSSDPKSVAAVEKTLQDLLQTFGISDLLPHCVLSHIDVQAQVEDESPGSTALWFQSIAGNEAANGTFDISVDKMRRYAEQRQGKFGLYFETGQGADFTNGHGHGFDMVMHESRKYGFARALQRVVAATRRQTDPQFEPWVHLNDVAGFIGPEVFRTREQLVRCCLEDLVMGKLHGLCIGLDVCSTLHMEVSLTDLDWCLEQIMPANPAYLMALPTKIDPMLGYLTTGYQDHVRLRDQFGFRVNDAMWKFFQQLGIIGQDHAPTRHFGDPLWVFFQYQRRKGDMRSEADIRAEGREQMRAVRQRGLFLAEGYDREPGKLNPSLRQDIQRIYDDAKLSIWAEWDRKFIRQIPNALPLATESKDRRDYILHPASGEQLSDQSVETLQTLEQNGIADVQIVISDGLNALAVQQDEQLLPFLNRVRAALKKQQLQVAPEHLVVTAGRVRAGYRIGETIFAAAPAKHAILHVIGERPGSGHRTFSAYLTVADGKTWKQPGVVDHNITRVVSGIATTALAPQRGAEETANILANLFQRAS